MELKHKIALIRIEQKNACSEPRREAVAEYLKKNPEIPRDEVRALLPFTTIEE